MSSIRTILKIDTRFVSRREIILFIGIAISSLLLSVATDKYLNAQNIIPMVIGMTYDLVIAFGITIILIMGEIDLSVGSVFGLTGIITSLSLLAGLGVALSIALGLATALVAGTINGLIVAKFKIASFIVTLGMMSIARGISVVLTSGYTLVGFPKSYLKIGQGTLLSIPYSIWFVVVLLIIMQLLLRHWRPFYSLYFIGNNKEAARLSGIRVSKSILVGFILCSLLAGVSAVFMTSRLAQGQSAFGIGAELRAIAGAVIGGAKLEGGSSTILGTFLGVFLIAIINNGFVILNAPIYWQGVVNGVILIIAIAANSYKDRQE